MQRANSLVYLLIEKRQSGEQWNDLQHSTSLIRQQHSWATVIEELLRQWKVDLSETPDEQNLPSASVLIQAICLLLGNNADNTLSYSEHEFVQNNVPPPASPKRRQQVKLADLKVGGCPTHEYTQETRPRSRLSADDNCSRKRKREVAPEAPKSSGSRADTHEAATCPRLSADNSEPIRKRSRLAETPESNTQKPRRARRRRARLLRVKLLKQLTFARMSRDSALCCWDDCCSTWRHRFSERGF